MKLRRVRPRRNKSHSGFHRMTLKEAYELNQLLLRQYWYVVEEYCCGLMEKLIDRKLKVLIAHVGWFTCSSYLPDDWIPEITKDNDGAFAAMTHCPFCGEKVKDLDVGIWSQRKMYGVCMGFKPASEVLMWEWVMDWRKK